MDALRDRTALIGLFGSMTAVYLVMMSFTGFWPWQADPYNSYALQAQSWLQGRLDLGVHPTGLQIAEYQGRYYVSFPPFPSLVVLPFVALLGPAQSPDHLLSLVAGFLAAWYGYRIARRLGSSSSEAVFWALFVTVGSNFLLVSSCGRVWYMAQSFSFALSLAAIHYALSPRFRDGFIATGLFAFSLGCRPFQVVFFPVLAWLLLNKLQGPSRQKLTGLLWLLPAMVIGAAYAWLNYARFGNALEFGHNYLPEFVAAPLGQFNLAYLPQNLPQLFFLPPLVDGRVRFPVALGFGFFIASPIFLSFVLLWGSSWRSLTPIEPLQRLLLPALLIMFILLIASHKTLGGIQFGNRYMVDVLPYLLLGILLLHPGSPSAFWQHPLHHALFFFGLVLNAVGGIAVFNQWI